MKAYFSALLAVFALVGVSVTAEEAAAPAVAAPQASIAAPQDSVAAIQQQLDAVKAKAKDIEKSLSPFRQKTASVAAVKEAKVKADEAKKLWEDAQRQALAAIPEAADLLSKLEAAKAEEKALQEKKTAAEKAAKAKK